MKSFPFKPLIWDTCASQGILNCVENTFFIDFILVIIDPISVSATKWVFFAVVIAAGPAFFMTTIVGADAGSWKQVVYTVEAA